MRERDFFKTDPGLYIATKPLYVSSRVLKAAARAGIEVAWDEKGRIHKIPFYDAKKLLAELGATMLTPKEYFALLADLKAKGDDELASKVETKEFAEWLDSAYKVVDGVTYKKDRPTERDTEGNTLEQFEIAQMQAGRPGWFRFNSAKINEQGFPQNVHEDKAAAEDRKADENDDELWKYWSAQRTDIPVGVLRCYVLSSDTDSLDNDIPLIARHPKIMIREVRSTLEDLQQANEPTLALLRMIDDYRKTLVLNPMVRRDNEIEAFFSDFAPKSEIIDNYRRDGIVEDDIERRSVEETLSDILGKAKAYDRAHGAADEEGNTVLTKPDLIEFLDQCPERIETALKNKDKIVFVRGHDNPDADVVFSAVFEALRRSKVYGEVVVPVVSGTLSDDIINVFGEDICKKILHTSSRLYKQAEKSGLVRWTYVDTQETTNDQFLDSVVDHRLTPKEFPYFVAVSREVGWSATLQVYNKILGCGLDLDKELSGMLLAGTLLEAEYTLLEKVMAGTDRMLYDDLVRRAECKDPKALYTKVIQPLLAKTDAETLFIRDYKQSHEMLGFAVVKQSGMYDDKGQCLNDPVRQQLLESACKNNKRLNIPLTLVKIVDYRPDGVGVNCEEFLPVFNENWHDLGFKSAITDVLKQTLEQYHKGNAEIVCSDESIKVPSANVQLPRLLLAPLLSPLAEEHAKFFFSKSLGKYVARGFYDGSREPYWEGTEKSERQNYITYQDMKGLVDGVENVSVLTLGEYWKVYKEALGSRDKNMLVTLRDPRFVEMLDTFIVNSKSVFDRPCLNGNGEPDAGSPCVGADIAYAHPGLIYPLQVDSIGIPVPEKIRQPDIYGSKLWRYWSPDKKRLIACRSHIFLLDQTSLDLKIPPTEKHRNMGFRPVYESVPPIRYSVEERERWVSVRIEPRSFGVYERPQEPVVNRERNWKSLPVLG
jgi:inorganic pyrophosphatase/exopolyphosphatase